MPSIRACLHLSSIAAALGGLLLIGCDDSPTPDADGSTLDAGDPFDAAAGDGGAPDGDAPDPDADLDSGSPDQAVGGGAFDAAPDTAAPDTAAPDAAARDPLPALALPLAEAEIDGPHARRPTGVLLDPGGSLRWTIDAPGPLAELAAVHLAVSAEIWRVEDGAFTVTWGDSAPRPVMVRGDADAAPERARIPYAEWAAPAYGLDARPPAHPLPTGDGPWTLVLTATGGSVEVRDAWLLDHIGATPLPGAPAEIERAVIAIEPCGADCDDGAALTAAIAEAPPGPTLIQLSAAVYTLRTPLNINRGEIVLAGVAGADGAQTTLWWDPEVGGQRAPVRVAGAGWRLGEAVTLDGPLEAASRRYRVNAPADWAPDWLWVTADDFGEVPPVCVEGRDVERFNRHLGRLVRVLSVSPEADGEAVVVEVDRPFNLDVPAEANPRLVPVAAIRDIQVRDLNLATNCPEAAAIADFSQADCANAEVLNDDGLVIEWADGVRVERVHSTGFGKFAIRVQRAVDVRLYACSMDHPAAYGGGGQGYGVHTIFSGRTLVRDQRVEVARHGVVIDFGSTDTQVIGGVFRTMNQALIDVHGEGSYDTLIRGADLATSNLGIIVGGGGREVHCNDGPRHHIEHNRIDDTGLAAVSVSDYTRTVFVRGNELDRSGTHVTVAFGGGDVLVERNVIGAVTLGLAPISLLNADTGDVVVRRNLFTAACSAEAAARAIIGAEDPVLEENAFCPE